MKAGASAEEKKTLWTDIEKELLNGQKLQGTLTCEEIVAVLKKNGATAEFPFFMAVNDVSFAAAVDPASFYDRIAA